MQGGNKYATKKPILSRPGETVTPQCPSPFHHTARAGEGRAGSDRDRRINHPKCVCPYTLQLLARSHEKRSERAIVQRKSEGRVYLNNVDTTVRRPDFAAGGAACVVTTAGVVAMEQYMDNPQAEGCTREARNVCISCPMLVKCDAWVTRAEVPASSWGGMYAGMTPSQRHARAEKREAAS